MLYAIVSDLHANRQAWQAVLTDIRGHGANDIICLGDVVGYGPAPANVLASVHTHVRHLVLGNHDAALCGRLSPEHFNADARRILEWTRGRLDARAVAFFRQAPLVLEGNGFRCAHAEVSAPARYRYLFAPADAAPTWQACAEALCFVGHTHRPAIFVIGASGVPREAPVQDFAVEEGKRFVVNVGSVGQPRDGGMLASYCLLDSERRSVFFRQVPFDVDGYRRDLEAAGLPAGPSHFLDVAASRHIPAVREMVTFRPPADEVEKASVATIEQYARAARRWRGVGLLALTLSLLLVLAGYLAWRQYRLAKEGVTFAAAPGSDVFLDLGPVGENLLAMPEPVGAVAAENRLNGWSVWLGVPRRQHVAVEEVVTSESGGGTRGFRLVSETRGALVVRSRPLVAPTGSRFRAQAQFRARRFDGGTVEVAIIEELAEGGERVLARSKARKFASSSRLSLSDTIERPLGGGERIRFAILADFAGDVSIHKCELLRRE
ncbi:MAG: phosphodiesterase [Lentisphaerae bacterium ADurb.BinA184]|nr:MAG: phosphodiesterase [Lentisphaerae bacterium ADurb.BinA184]